jgi:hypothetical protein
MSGYLKPYIAATYKPGHRFDLSAMPSKFAEMRAAGLDIDW